ncbi:ATP-binding protein [Niveibacterium sp. 24ML]|uniref:ATP-binding protein n=1 Tax=Niveibacterium sp. 24ML TaxID=2985512 RepID=UPI0022701EAE|nr:ATP-binding protein [Niveibacterium sp. 24ML]MCX9156340.1 ATP-binding protein [Niveibacterium sp. 24ML]
MSAGEPRRPLILLVDDQPANLHVLAASLKSQYRIKTATHGAAALELAQIDGDRPQLILLDVMMPELSGMDVLRALRAGASTHDIPVIIVTADTSEASQLEGLALGADDFLTKPVSPAVLLARVANLLRRTQAEARFRMVLQQSPTALLIVDRQHRIAFSNPVAEVVFGYPAGAMLGLPLGALIPDSLRERHDQFARHCLREEDVRRSAHGRELPARRCDGSDFPAEIGLSPIPGDDGMQVLVSVTDMSGRAQIEQRLREVNDALEQRVAARTAELEARNRELLAAISSLSEARQQVAQAEKLASLGRLVAAFAHDIGNPIGNVATLASMLAEKQRSLSASVSAGSLKRSDLEAFLATGEEAYSLVERNLERARELLASFKQLALDQATSQQRAIDLLDWLGQFTYTLSPSLVGGGHHVVVDVPAGLSIKTAPGLLGQVIANLVSNAVTHGFEGRTGGVIRITAVRTDDGRIEIAVSDDGAGIAPGDLPRVFEPYFTTRAGKGGTGLGLDIVRGIVEESLGGQIAIESAPGVGTTFTIRLPAQG